MTRLSSKEINAARQYIRHIRRAEKRHHINRSMQTKLPSAIRGGIAPMSSHAKREAKR